MRTEVRLKARFDVDTRFIAPATLPGSGPGVKREIRGGCQVRKLRTWTEPSPQGLTVSLPELVPGP